MNFVLTLEKQWSVRVYSLLHSCLKIPRVDYLQINNYMHAAAKSVNGLNQLDQTKIGRVQQNKQSHQSQIVFNHIRIIYI